MKRRSSAKLTTSKLARRSTAAAADLSLAAPWRSAIWAALLGSLAALIVFAPAAWLARAVQLATSGHVLLADAQGSVWRGSAQLFLTGGESAQDATGLPGRVDWTLRPAWSGARMALNVPCCTKEPIALQLRPGLTQARVDVSPAKINLPAQWLAGLGAPWNTLDPRGQLMLSNEPLQVQMLWSAGRTRLEGSLTLDMLEMSSRLSTLAPLGDYRLRIAGGDVPSLQLQTLQGALQLQGSGQVVGSKIRFSGEASAAPEREAALSNVLNIIGRRQGTKSLISLG
jgi:general secretion pathway protein N